MWNFNNGQCVKILKKDGNCDQICDCLYLKLHRKAFVVSVGWDRRIDVYEDSKEETQKTQRPKPSWQDDVKNGHKEDILCIAQYPPHHLATGSYDGEIIVWNVVSERILCRFQIASRTNSTGTFGQNEKWCIDTPSSWKHPSQPTLERETKSFLKSDKAKNEKSESDVLNIDSDPPMSHLEDGPSSSYLLPELGKRQCCPKRTSDRKGLRDYLTFEDFNFTLPTIEKPDLSKVLSNNADD